MAAPGMRRNMVASCLFISATADIGSIGLKIRSLENSGAHFIKTQAWFRSRACWAGSRTSILQGAAQTMPKPQIHELRVGEVARRVRVAVSTVHFYEAQGLIESRRTKGNQRRYARSVLRLIAIIKVAQRVGIPLAQIRDRLASLPSHRPL